MNTEKRGENVDRGFFVAHSMAMERSLYYIARSYRLSQADCEDAVQSALLRAWEKRDSLRKERYFNTWLTRIMINTCKEMLRRRREMPVEALPERPVPVAEERGLWPLLMEMEEKYRIMVVLHYRDGYSIAEIARILRLPQSTVKTRLYRARERLRSAAVEAEVSI